MHEGREVKVTLDVQQWYRVVNALRSVAVTDSYNDALLREYADEIEFTVEGGV